MMGTCAAVFVLAAVVGGIFHPADHLMRVLAITAGCVFIVGAGVWLFGIGEGPTR